MRRSALLFAPLLALACSNDSPGASEAPAGTFRVEVDGFSTPESVLHDAAADVYLVSNINGDPLEAADNGFISRVTPEGDVQERRWIDGDDRDVVLNAPKGMAILGDTLYVADIDCVRMFHRVSGDAAGEVCFEEATFLNDVAADEHGVLYVTDSGFEQTAEGFGPSGTDAVYRFYPDGRRAKLIGGPALGAPNGIVFGSRGGLVVTFGSGEIYQLAPDGSRVVVLPPNPERQLDGIIMSPDGGFVFSSWGEQAVLWVGQRGAVTRVLEGVETPADIGYDATRNRILVPLFNLDEVVIVDLPAEAGVAPAVGAAG